MNLNQITDVSIANDIMYGSTPKDMVNRAFKNHDILNLFKYFKLIVKSDDYVETNFRNFINNATSYLTVGQYTAYLILLYLLSKSKAIKIASEINNKLSPDSMLYAVNSEILTTHK